MPTDATLQSGVSPLVQGQALWDWDLSNPLSPVISGWGGYPTKTGLMPADLQAFVGIPLQYYGNPPTPISPSTILSWLQWAEAWVEQETNLLLYPTWIASPPTLTPGSTQATGMLVSGSSGVQQLGLDYDLADAPYDFFFPRAQDEGWMIQQLRYKPLVTAYGNADLNKMKQYTTGVQNVAYIYPLLSDFFRVPPTWFVEDRDFGLVRLVPAANVQMLPLFAMQLAFMGFAESIPGGMWFQYTAGLTSVDYMGRFAFIKQLVLAAAAVQALSSIQATVNYGAQSTQMSVDGMQYRVDYDKAGPFNGFIMRFEKMKADLLNTAFTKVSGPNWITL